MVGVARRAECLRREAPRAVTWMPPLASAGGRGPPPGAARGPNGCRGNCIDTVGTSLLDFCCCLPGRPAISCAPGTRTALPASATSVLAARPMCRREFGGKMVASASGLLCGPGRKADASGCTVGAAGTRAATGSVRPGRPAGEVQRRAAAQIKAWDPRAGSRWRMPGRCRRPAAGHPVVTNPAMLAATGPPPPLCRLALLVHHATADAATCSRSPPRGWPGQG